MIPIILNGKKININSEMTISNLLSVNKIKGSFAIAINMNFIPKNTWNNTKIKANDNIELIAPMQGG